MKKALRSSSKFAAAFVALAIASPFAGAQSVPGTRLPVRTACPHVDQALPDALNAAWHRLGAPAEIVVEFRVQGQTVFDPVAVSGPARYYLPVRNAVRKLECDGRDASVHDVRLRVSFVKPSSAGDDDGVATIVDMDDRVAAAR